jgi:hypothetical protein
VLDDGIEQQIKQDIPDDDENDHIIEGSTVFNNKDFMDHEHMAISRMAADRMSKGRSVGSKDLTHEAN